MIINLSEVSFEGDFFYIDLPDSSSLVLNKLNEDIKIESNNSVIKIINVQTVELDGKIVTRPCIIGMGDDKLQIITDYKQFEGKTLTEDNMAFCRIEVYE